MKKIFLIVSLVLTVYKLSWAAWTANALTWFNYGLTIKTNDILGGSFYVERARLELRGDIAKDVFGNIISGRFSADLHTPIVRYAYFDYKILNEFIMSAGILPFYFGNIVCNWGYSPVLPDVAERFASFRPIPNTDFGIMLSGNAIQQISFEEKNVEVIKTNTKETGEQTIDKESTTVINTNKWNLLSYFAGILNGEGYRELFSAGPFITNTFNLAYFGTISINPIKDISIIGSLKYQPYSSGKDGVFKLKDELSYAVALSAKKPLNIPLELLIEYIGVSRTLSPATGATPTTGFIFGTYIGYGLFNGIFTPYVRFDMSDSDISGVASDYSVLDVGYIFRPSKSNWELHGTVSYWLNKNGATSGDIDVILKFVYLISATIKD